MGVIALAAMAVHGEIIEIGLSAEITYMDDSAKSLLDGQLEVGDTITGGYMYDSDTLDSNPLETVGDYWHDSGPYGIVLNGVGFTFQSDPADMWFVLEVGDNHAYSTDDHYLIRSYNNLALSNGVLVDLIGWELQDPTGTALSSDALPLGPPVLSDWQYQTLMINLGFKGGAILRAQVTSVWLIPEPATVLLLGCGSVLLLRKRRAGW
jgi:hypothetical protein